MEATQSLINSCGKLFPEWITEWKGVTFVAAVRSL